MNFALEYNSVLDLFLHLLVVIPHLVNHDVRTTSNLSSLLNSQIDHLILSFQHSVEHRASCHLLLRHFSTRSSLIYFAVNDCLNWCHIIEGIENSDVALFPSLCCASLIKEQLLDCQSYHSVDHQRLGTVYYLPLEHLIVNQCPNLRHYPPFRYHIFTFLPVSPIIATGVTFSKTV